MLNIINTEYDLLQPYNANCSMRFSTFYCCPVVVIIKIVDFNLVFMKMKGVPLKVQFLLQVTLAATLRNTQFFFFSARPMCVFYTIPTTITDLLLNIINHLVFLIERNCVLLK